MIEVWIDGLCKRFDHGGAGFFAFIIKRDGAEIDRKDGIIGMVSGMTSNVAEYTALIRALERVKSLGVEKEKIVVRSDSMFVVNQMNGRWQVQSKLLLPLYTEAKELACDIDVAFEWIPQEENTEANDLSYSAYHPWREHVERERKRWRKTREIKYFQF